MSEIFFEFKEDAVAKYTHIAGMPEDMYNVEVVMTKEIFQECYKRWIEPNESGDKIIDATAEAIKAERDGEDG